MGTISRRSFIAGGALSGVTATVALMAGCSPTSSDSGGISSRGESENYREAPEPLSESDAKEVIEADVAVVGLGNAGVVAAVTAAEEGAKVVAFQKTDSTYTFGTGVAWPNSSALEASGVRNDPWVIVNAIQRGLNENHGKTVLWRNWVRYGEEVANWWIAKMATNSELGPVSAGEAEPVDADNPWNATYSATHVSLGSLTVEGEPFNSISAYLFENAIEGGADIDARFNTPAVQLLTDDDGRVIGVFGKDEDDEYILCKTSKGVILATGGYSGNDEMRNDYMPMYATIPTAQPGQIENGDGILMGSWVGGRIEGAPHCAAIHYDPAVSVPDYMGDVVPWLRVNLDGKRFSNEDMGYALMPLQDILQPEGSHFQVFDSNYAEDSKSMGQGSLFGDWETLVPQAIEAGDIYSGDTLEELGKAMGVPSDVFADEVERYNELCEKGYDEDFGKQQSRLKPVVKAPFYAFKRHASLLATLSGLEVNADYQVLDENDHVIEGLYAVGNDSGGMFGGVQYPLNIPGISIGRAMLSGRVAAWRVCGKAE